MIGTSQDIHLSHTGTSHPTAQHTGRHSTAAAAPPFSQKVLLYECKLQALEKKEMKKAKILFNRGCALLEDTKWRVTKRGRRAEPHFNLCLEPQKVV